MAVSMQYMKNVLSKTLLILALAQADTIYSKGAGASSKEAHEAERERERWARKANLLANKLAPAYHIRYSSLRQLALIKQAKESLGSELSDLEEIQIKKIIIEAQQILLTNSEKLKRLIFDVRNSDDDGDIIRGFSIETNAIELCAQNLLSNLKENLKGTDIAISDKELLEEANSLIRQVQQMQD